MQNQIIKLKDLLVKVCNSGLHDKDQKELILNIVKEIETKAPLIKVEKKKKLVTFQETEKLADKSQDDSYNENEKFYNNLYLNKEVAGTFLYFVN